MNVFPELQRHLHVFLRTIRALAVTNRLGSKGSQTQNAHPHKHATNTAREQKTAQRIFIIVIIGSEATERAVTASGLPTKHTIHWTMTNFPPPPPNPRFPAPPGAPGASSRFAPPPPPGGGAANPPPPAPGGGGFAPPPPPAAGMNQLNSSMGRMAVQQPPAAPQQQQPRMFSPPAASSQPG